MSSNQLLDRPLLGIALMFGFCLLAPLGDALAKLLGETIPLVQLLLARFALQAALLVPLAILTRRSIAMTPRVLKLTIIRTLLHIIGIGAMFTSLRFLPLAEAVAIAFVMPFIMLLLGRYVLDEEVGPRRLAACAVGFIGTLCVVQPSFAAVGAPALLPLVVAVVFALFMLTTRQIAKDVDPISLQATSGLLACAILGIGYVVAPAHTDIFSWATPSAVEGSMMILIGTIGTVAHLLMVWSLRYAPSATLAPMQYLEIPIATIIGFLFFRDWPNGLAFIGICITIGAGLYVVYREHRVPSVAKAV
ncbi:MAG: DMT family transporter [Litoreibacter sp.]